MAEETAMRGAAAVTVARVIARAGVSRRVFYELFADIEDCFVATLEWAVEQAGSVAVEAYEAQDSWRESIRGALAALLRFFDEQPLLAQLCIVHAAGGGPRVLELRSRTIAQLCQVVDRGHSEVSGGRVPGPVVAEGVVGAVIAVLYTRLLGGPAPAPGAAGAIVSGPGESSSSEGAPRDVAARSEDPAGLIDLHGELMSLIVLPYLGASTARKELERPPPSTPVAKTSAAALPASSTGAGAARGPHDLSDGARAAGHRGVTRGQQPRSRRTRRHRRSRPDLEDPDALGVPRSGGQPGEQHGRARHAERVVADRAWGADRAGIE